MKIGQHIKDAQYWVQQLKAKMPYIKDQVKLDKHISLINMIITLTNDVEFLIEQKYSGDVVDKLILARFYSQIFPLYKPHDKIDVKQIVRNIDDNITTPKAVLKKDIIDFLVGKEIDLELTKQQPSLNTITSKEQYEEMIDDMVNQVKQHIEWN